MGVHKKLEICFLVYCVMLSFKSLTGFLQTFWKKPHDKLNQTQEDLKKTQENSFRIEEYVNLKQLI